MFTYELQYNESIDMTYYLVCCIVWTIYLKKLCDYYI